MGAQEMFVIIWAVNFPRLKTETQPWEQEGQQEKQEQAGEVPQSQMSPSGCWKTKDNWENLESNQREKIA